MDHWLTTADGTRLLTRAWAAQEPFTSLLVVHGIGEHSGRYEKLAQDLTHAGVSVFAYDHRGHGRSDGRRGHLRHFTDWLDDLERAVAWVRSQTPGAVFLLGHSLGGLITVHAVARQPTLCDGIILSSPACGLAQPVPRWKQTLAVLASAVWPTLAFDRAHADGAYLSHDPAISAAYLADPLVHFKVTARAYLAMRAALNDVQRAASLVHLPALVLQAGDDHLVAAQATRAMAEALASTDKRLVWLDGWYHEVFNEVQRVQVVEELVGWLKAHAQRAA